MILAKAGSEGKAHITINIPHGGDGHKSGPGARAKADARKAVPNRSGNSKTSKPRSSGNSHYFADGFTAQPKFSARPGQNIRLPNADQKSTKHKQTRTRVNNENRAKVREEIQSILSNPENEIYPNVTIGGVQGRVYYCTETNRMVGIFTEGELGSQIIKANKIGKKQLDMLGEFEKMD